MNIIKHGFDKGFVIVKINVNDDLWYLENVIEKGDFVKTRTLRNIFIERQGQQVKAEKKPMVLKIEVEKIEFQKFTNQLRLTGKITEGPDDVQLGSYHTIEVKLSTILTIYKKEWKKYQIDRLKKALTKVPDVLIAVVDSNQATFGMLKRSGVEIVSELRNPHSTTQEEEKLPEFYKKIASEIEKFSEKVERIVLAGPGFTKEHVQKIIQDNYPDVKSKLIIDTTTSATETGVNEILKKGTLDKIIRESEIVKESQVIQEFFTHLNKDDGLSVYGLDQIKDADNTGAVKILLVSDENIRKEEIDRLAKKVEEKKGQVEIISKTHELGEQFHRMGGLGAILRFRIY
ncbi:MAG: mRNA surveillance protein pelota [Candidatus Aenigmarchaeota archaeon]|nr:mRNA surveillance protein pelota [Candidatus Aenigmarchaeota archaeon]